MSFVSTRGFSDASFTFFDVITKGLAPDGGLFLPTALPSFSLSEIVSLAHKPYAQKLALVLSRFTLGIESDVLEQLASKAYSSFHHSATVPVVKLNEKNAIIELFHGPTASFKDMALQMTPYLFYEALKAKNDTNNYCVLTATSGDTGIAAIEGFKKIPNVSVVVLYPKGGVSALQEMQMRSVAEKNVFVLAVESDFDFCQTSVKKIFSDAEFASYAATKNIKLTAANSMNWGRLLPQVVYYFSAYADLVAQQSITAGENIEVCVPSGNFGNLLAAFLASKMGVPIAKFICASNENNTLSEFFNTGTYSLTNKTLLATDSPSIDILLASNIERFLYLMNGGNAEQIKTWFEELASKGSFTIDDELFKRIQQLFSANYCVHEQMQQTIQSVLLEHNYLLDPHTAVAVQVASTVPVQHFRLIASTAHYQKFAPAMMKVFKNPETDIAKMFGFLENLHSSVSSHKNLSELLSLPVVQNNTVSGDYEQLKQAIQNFLG